MISVEKISSELFTLIPPEKAVREKILPVELSDNVLLVAHHDKNNLNIVSELAFMTGYRIKVVEVPEEELTALINQATAGAKIDNGDNGTLPEKISVDTSTVEFVNSILNRAIEQRASDIHLETYDKEFRIRFRVDGHLREIARMPLSRSHSIRSRIKIMANLDISEKRRPQDGRIRYNYKERVIDIRVSTLPIQLGEKIVLRLLDKSMLRLDLREIGPEESQLELLRQKITLPYGMILVTGPTGSGKTTTLYAVLHAINSVDKNIVTIEDPVEYHLKGINQSQVKGEIGFTFANALRAFLRQDPDIMMVGEIRDRETAEVAVRASLTGHLVLSTLHTNDSVSAITRLADIGIDPYLIAASLKMVIAQRLVRKLCSCKQHLNGSYVKNGCEKCAGTGFNGRTGLFEILVVDDDLAAAVSRGETYDRLRMKAESKGFQTLANSGENKIRAGITTYEEVSRETAL